METEPETVWSLRCAICFLLTQNASDMMLESQIRAPSATPVDDAVLPFEVSALDVRGRLTRMGPALDEILTKHDYPAPVGKLLGEAIVLTTLLGSTLKFDGRFILQTQTDGPVSLIVVDFHAPDRLRAYARFDASRLEAGQDSAALLGHGHLAMTIDQGADMSRYQGLVALEGGNLEDAAHEYFLRSEQIPTRVRLAVGEEFRGGDGPKHRWRGGGMLMQFLPKAPERARQPDLHPGDVPEGAVVHEIRRMTPGPKAVRCSKPSRTSNSSIRIYRANGCCSGCFMNAACGCFRRRKFTRNVRVRAMRCPECSQVST